MYETNNNTHYREMNLNESCLLPVNGDRDQIAVEFNRAVLAQDLRSIKKKVDQLNGGIVKDLNNYFDSICQLAKYDSNIFKSFLIKLIEER